MKFDYKENFRLAPKLTSRIVGITGLGRVVGKYESPTYNVIITNLAGFHLALSESTSDEYNLLYKDAIDLKDGRFNSSLDFGNQQPIEFSADTLVGILDIWREKVPAWTLANNGFDETMSYDELKQHFKRITKRTIPASSGGFYLSPPASYDVTNNPSYQNY